ncbi:MAG: PepSY domain-containing protein [Lactobacillus sp.]|jgi:uncharacterized membrane protein YkoI|nr:PepSY domain-containing protein [Lactobacillus sp.]MCI2033452.1 PepSY domain-containing protein [Lactobacillus sp.]
MKPWWLFLTSVALIGLTGCRQSQEPKPTTSQSEQTSTQTARPSTIKFSLEQAWHQFTVQFPEAHVTSLELAREANGYRYQFEGQDTQHEVELVLDATTGKILAHHQEALADDEHEEAISRSGLVTRQRASKVAVAQVGSGSATAWQLDHDDGRVIWEVTVHTGQAKHEVVIDAYSAEVLSAEIDD